MNDRLNSKQLPYLMIIARKVGALCLTLLAVLPAKAQCFPNQLAKLLPNDGTAGDQFGHGAISISGTTAVVGAWNHDHIFDRSGSAYLFDTTTGQQIAQLLPNDPADFGIFGYSNAIDESFAVVGAPGARSNNVRVGGAYLFDLATHQQTLKFSASDRQEGDVLGVSVAISGTTVVVGAGLDDNENGVDAGAAYLFDTISGQQIAKLLPDDGAAGDWFGDRNCVATNGSVAIVGATLKDNGAGAAYLFDMTTGLQITKLLADDRAAGDRFGRCAIQGNLAIITALQDDDNGEDSGSAYVFDITTGEQLAKLLPDDGAAGDNFGGSVSISGNIAVIGAWHCDNNGEDSGAAYLFDIVTGQQLAKLLPDDGAAGDSFGRDVAVSEATVIVAASYDDDNGMDSGSAYLFDTGCASGVVSVSPDSYLVTRGAHVSGGIPELADSDNQDLSLRRLTSDIQSRTEFTVKAISPTATPSSLEVTLEGAVFARSTVNQTIELYDYGAGAWEQVDTRAATRFTDSTVSVAATGDLSRFVQPGTMCLEARIRYQSPSARQQFSSNTDQFIWMIGQ